MKGINKKFIIIMFVVTVILASVMAVSFKTGKNAVGGAVDRVLTPLQKVSATVVNSAKRTAKNIKNSSKNEKENKKLKSRIASLEDELRMVEGYKTENEKLMKLLELKDTRKTFKSTAANIIGRKTGDLYYTITLDKGKKDGIKKNAVVTVPEGLVGVVSEVRESSCVVKTIFDAESSVAAICSRSGDMGVVEGNTMMSKEGKCAMNYIDKEAKTVVGDNIETSGTGGIFPRGILIGKVVGIGDDERKLTLSASIEASVKINSIDVVLVSIDN